MSSILTRTTGCQWSLLGKKLLLPLDLFVITYQLLMARVSFSYQFSLGFIFLFCFLQIIRENIISLHATELPSSEDLSLETLA